tara:strand:+ start:52 stop:417 length:366 start_codon:yes stop_codon:yes gene_type:complete
VDGRLWDLGGPYESVDDDGTGNGRKDGPAGFSINDLIWCLCRPAGIAGVSGYGMLPSEASQLTLAQVMNLLRPADEHRKGKPKRVGKRERLAYQQELEDLKSAADDLRLAMEAIERKNNAQ